MVAAVYISVVGRGWGRGWCMSLVSATTAVAVISGDCEGGMTVLTIVIIVIV